MPPTLLIDRLPIPSIRNYIIFSVLIVTFALLSSYGYVEEVMVEKLNTTQSFSKEETAILYRTLTWDEWLECFWSAITSQLWTLWVG